MQLKMQSVEARQNEKHYSKESNTSENPIPRREIFKSVDHVKYGQVRSGHNNCCLCSFLVEFSSCRVTYENCNKSSVFKSSLRWVDGFKKFQRYWVKELLLYNRMEAFFENLDQKWKDASCRAQFRYFQIKKVKNPSVRLKILTYESPMQSYIKTRVKLWEQIQFKG